MQSMSGLCLTQSEALELLAVLVQFGEENAWLELVAAGAVHTSDRPLIPAVRFNLLACADADAELDFRFPVRGILCLVALLRLPANITTERGDRCSVEEAMCILLYRLSYPRRLHDMRSKFGRASCALSSIVLYMVDMIDTGIEGKLYFHKRLISEQIESYCSAISARAPVTSVFAFPDGTKIPTCRPSGRARRRAESLQDQVYSDHKRIHCIIYQGLTAPDGLYIHYWGPYEGRRHDSTVFTASKLLAYFEDNDDIFAGKAIFGDPAYPLSKYCVTGFKSAVLTIHQRIFNREMSAVRTSVEWNFKIMKTSFAFISYAKGLKIRLSPVGEYVRVAMFLTNCQTCFRGGNQISAFFSLQPPSLEDYLED